MGQVLRLDETSIANEALASAEQPPIGSLTSDKGKPAETCRTYYASLRKTLQAGYKWNCTSFWKEFPEANDAPAHPDFKCAYRMPGSVLRIVEVRGAGRSFEKMGVYLYCNVPLKAMINVIELVEDPSLWDERLRAVFVATLAYKIAPRLGTSEGRIQELKDEQRALSKKMTRIDADENGNADLPRGSWVASRYGGGC